MSQGWLYPYIYPPCGVAYSARTATVAAAVEGGSAVECREWWHSHYLVLSAHCAFGNPNSASVEMATVAEKEKENKWGSPVMGDTWQISGTVVARRGRGNGRCATAASWVRGETCS